MLARIFVNKGFCGQASKFQVERTSFYTTLNINLNRFLKCRRMAAAIGGASCECRKYVFSVCMSECVPIQENMSITVYFSQKQSWERKVIFPNLFAEPKCLNFAHTKSELCDVKIEELYRRFLSDRAVADPQYTNRCPHPTHGVNAGLGLGPVSDKKTHTQKSRLKS